MDIKESILQLTYQIKTNSKLSELESYNLANKLAPFIEDAVEKGVNEKLAPLRQSIDELTAAVDDLVKRKNSGYRLDGEHNGQSYQI